MVDNYKLLCILTIIVVIGCFTLSTYCLTGGFKYSLQDSFNKAMTDQENWQEQNRQCVDTCVHNGGIFETCLPRCQRGV
jgi:hypothetical protein